MATKFSSVFGSARGLLSDNYKYTNSVSTKTKTANGVTFATNAKIDSAKGASASVKGSVALDNLSIDKVEVGTNKVVAADLTLKGYVPNTKFTFKAADGARAAASSYGKLGLVYTQSPAVFTAEVDVINGPTVNTSLCVNYDGVLAGASAVANTNLHGDKPGAGFDLKDYSALVGYKGADFTAAVLASKKLTKVDVGFHHKVDSQFSAAGIVKFNLDRKATDKAFDVEFGGRYKLDSQSTVEGKICSHGKLSMNYQQKLSSNADATIAAQLNVADLVSDDHKFGISLKLHN